MEPAAQRMKVFISYSHKDQWYLEEFKRHLQLLENQKLIELWHDKKIEDGAQWRVAIEKAVQEAKVAILLISIDFLNSKFIAENELPPFLRAAKEDGITIIPVLLGPCDFEASNIAIYKIANDTNKPIAGLSKVNREKEWTKIATRVRKLVGHQQSSSSTAAVILPSENVPPSSNSTTVTIPQPADQSPPSDNPTIIASPPENQPQLLDITPGGVSPITKKAKTNSLHQTMKIKRFCPYCHEEIDFTLCTIVATQPLYERGTPLSTAAQRLSLDQEGIEKIFERHKKSQPCYQCHRCKYILPPDITTTPFKKIIVVGNSESGLPSYFAALIYQMNKQSASNQLSCVTPLVTERYNQRISHVPFLSLSELVRITNLEAKDPACPLIYEFPARTLLHRRLPKTYLAIYEVTDSAFADNFRIQQHVAQADACIYLHSSQESSAAASESFLRTLLSRLSKATPFARLPVAVTFTKADQLAPSALHFPSPPAFSTSSVDLTDLRAVEHMLLRALADNASAQTLITTAQKDIAPDYVHFFIASSLHNTSLSSEPFRCLDPLLWLLYKLGLIMTPPNNANNGSAS